MEDFSTTAVEEAKTSATAVEEIETSTTAIDAEASVPVEGEVATIKTEEDLDSDSTDTEKTKSSVITKPTDVMMEEMQITESISSTPVIISNPVAFWKRGCMHVQDRTRCQDTAFCIGYDDKDPLFDKYTENHNRIKVVMDGCGSCEYSLLGVLMFEQEFKKKAAEMELNSDNLEDVIKEIFQKMLQFDNSLSFILDNYLFTILICFEYEDRFEVCTCGDGFILYVRDEQVFFQEIEGTEKNEEGRILPNYFAYDLDVVKGKLSNYKAGTEFELYMFDKSTYPNVGVASDGLRFFTKLQDEEKIKFFSLIYYRLPIGLQRFLDEHKGLFLDDFSVAI